jgi:hypothetical protein
VRQFSRALLVTRDGQIPLYADVYEGNMVDATRFPASLTAIRQRLVRLVGQLEDLTLVYDKGNNAKANQALVDHLPVHYVASLVLTQHPELSAIPTVAYTPLETGPWAKVPVYRCRRTLGGPNGPWSSSSVRSCAGAKSGCSSSNSQNAWRPSMGIFSDSHATAHPQAPGT